MTDKTILVISHDEDFLNSFSDSVLYLDVFSKKVESYDGKYFFSFFFRFSTLLFYFISFPVFLSIFFSSISLFFFSCFFVPSVTLLLP